ncbi:hypothetical protein BaRGS_00034750 [Batillaria attramentaria]|uniref:Uncharacterized protein n=1 Tax=Batillaria attramentaria TaxID=370345 RepID=A0ABD0JGB6_9CAEN
MAPTYALRSDRSQSHTADDKQVTIVVYDLHKGNASTTVTRVGAARGVISKDVLTANLHDGDDGRRWNRVTLTERSPNTEHRKATQSPPPPLPKSAANRFRQTKPALPEVTLNPSPPQSPHQVERSHAAAGQGRKVTIRSLRAPTRIVINQQPDQAVSPQGTRQGIINSNDSSPRQSSENSRHQPTHSSVLKHSPKPEHKTADRQGSPRDSSDGSSKQTSQENASPHPQPHPPPRAHGFNYQRAARVLSSAHTPAPPSQEPTKRVRAPLAQERRGPRPKSVKFRADECSSHYQSTESPAQSSRPGDCEVQCEVRGNALHSHQSPVTSPRRHDRHANGFSASLEMFKRRLRLNQNKFLKDEGQAAEDKDYVIRLGDTKPTDAHISYRDAYTPTYDAHHNLADHRVPERDSQQSSGDDLVDSSLAIRERGLDGAEDGSDQRHFYRLSESTEDLPFMSLRDPVRTPLPQVKTYVVEEDSKRLQGRGLDKPAALTQHNIDLHNTLLQRRADKERAKAKRVERERHGGGAVGGGVSDSPDLDSRMKRWLLDTEHQRDFQPTEAAFNFKIAASP